MKSEKRAVLNRGLAQMLKGGVIMDVTTPDQARMQKMRVLWQYGPGARSRGYQTAGRGGEDD
jgi:hypothetical protein